MLSQSELGSTAITEENGLRKCDTVDPSVPFECREATQAAERLNLRASLNLDSSTSPVACKMKDAVVQAHPQVMSAVVLSRETHVLMPDSTIVENICSSAYSLHSRSFNWVK